MNIERCNLAIEDLLDCTDIFKDRCFRHGYPNEGDELERIAHAIYHRFSEVSSNRRRMNESRAWAALHRQLERMEKRSSDLVRLKVLDREERYFIHECLEEVHKYIRRALARREKPNWRRGA